MLEIHTIGFGELTRLGLDITSKVASIMFDSPLMAIVVILMVAFAALQSVARGKLDIMTMVLAVTLFLVMFVPRTDVLVVDHLADRFDAPVDVVTRVPLGLALAGSLSSVGSAWVSTLYQDWFITHGQSHAPNDMRRFGFPMRALMALREIESSDLGPRFHKTLTQYMRLCFHPAVQAGKIDIEELYKEPRLVFEPPEGTLLGFVPDNEDEEGSRSKTCRESGEWLAEYLEDALEPGTEANDRFNEYLRKKVGDASDDNATSTDEIRNILMTFIGATGEQRDFLVTHMSRQVQSSASMGGWGSDASTVWLTQAFERQRLTSAVEASGMLRIVIIMMGLLQFLFIVMTPVVAIIAIAKLGGGIKLYGSWFLLAIWSGMFLITVTVIDFWAQLALYKRFTVPYSEGYEGSHEYNALSVPGLEGLYATAADILTTAHTFLTYAPIVTLTVLTGSIFPLASLANRLAGGASAGNLPGMTAVGDSAAGNLGSNLDMPGNLEQANDPSTMPASLSHSNVDIKWSDAMLAKVAVATAWSSQLASQAHGVYQTAMNETISNVEAYFDSESTADEKAHAFDQLKALYKAFSTDEYTSDSFTEEKAYSFVSGLQAATGLNFGISSPSGGGSGSPSSSAGIAAGAQAYSKAEWSETEKEAYQVGRKLGETLGDRDGFSSSATDVLRASQSLGSTVTGQTADAWQEVRQYTESYVDSKARVASITDEASKVSGVTASASLNKDTAYALHAKLQAQGGVGGRIDSALSRYDADTQATLRQAGVVPDYSSGETTNANLDAMLALHEVAGDESMDTGSRMAASSILSNLFGEAIPGLNVAGTIFDEEAVGVLRQDPIIGDKVPTSPLSKDAVEARFGGQKDSVEGGMQGVRGEVSTTAPDKDKAWDQLLSIGAAQKNYGQAIGGDPVVRQTMRALGGSGHLMTDGRAAWAYGPLNEYAGSNDPGAGEKLVSGLLDKVPERSEGMLKWMIKQHTDADGNVDAGALSSSLNTLNMVDHSPVEIAAVQEALTTNQDPFAPEAALSYMAATGELSSAMGFVPDAYRGDAEGLVSAAAAPGSLAQAWANAVQDPAARSGSWAERDMSSRSLGGGDITKVGSGSPGALTQADVASYAAHQLADKRIPGAVHALKVHDAMMRHGDFSQDEMNRLDAAASTGGGRGELLSILGLEDDGHLPGGTRFENISANPFVTGTEAMRKATSQFANDRELMDKYKATSNYEYKYIR